MNSFSIAWNANDEMFALNPSYATEKRPPGRTPPQHLTSTRVSDLENSDRSRKNLETEHFPAENPEKQGENI